MKNAKRTTYSKSHRSEEKTGSFKKNIFFCFKGCYAYPTGIYEGLVFYGTGGSKEKMQDQVVQGKFRPQGYDCNGIHKIYTSKFSALQVFFLKKVCSVFYKKIS